MDDIDYYLNLPDDFDGEMIAPAQRIGSKLLDIALRKESTAAGTQDDVIMGAVSAYNVLRVKSVYSFGKRISFNIALELV